MTAAATLALVLATKTAFPASERSALQLAIAATRAAPPDLTGLIVQHRLEYLNGVRDAISRAPATDFSKEARALSQAIVSRTHFPDVIRRCGTIVGELLAFETPRFDSPEARLRFEEACAGPYTFPGVSAAAAAGNPEAVAASIARAAADFRERPPSARAAASRIVSDETNLLWAIWIGAGGDRRPARKFEEKNGPYDIAGAPR